MDSGNFEENQKNKGLMVYKPSGAIVPYSKVRVFLYKNGKRILAATGLALVITACSGYIDGKNSNGNSDEDSNTNYEIEEYVSKGNGGIVDSNGNDVITISSKNIQSIALKLKDNWDKLGVNYTLEEIEELVKFSYRLDSNINIDIFDEAIVKVINSATIPAVNNALIGQKVMETYELNILELLPHDTKGYGQIELLKNYLEILMRDPENTETYANFVLPRIIEINNNNSTNDFDPLVRLLWPRLVEVGINPIIGTLGSNFQVELNGVPYSTEDIISSDRYEELVSEAKSSYNVK